MDISEFKKIVHGVCRDLGMSIDDLYQPSVTPNFIACRLRHPHGKSVVVLCSENNDWAFADSFDPEVCTLDFVDDSDLSAKLDERYRIEAMSKKELNAPFSRRDYMQESDIKYWQPKTLGEGLFNWWD